MSSLLLKSFIPEIFLSLGILCQLVHNASLIHNLKNNFPLIDKEMLGQSIFFFLCLILLLLNSEIECFGENFLFINDKSTNYIKLLLIFSCVISFFVIIKSFRLQKLNFFEYFTIFFLAVFSLMLLISAGDLLFTYLVLEMQALSFYILAGFKRDSFFSSESGLKYFIFGSFISGIFLFGCSIIYGTLGTLDFSKLSLIFSFPFETTLASVYYIFLIGHFLIVITFLFKISAVPFHFWSPDVYEGAPIASTIIFSIIPKFAIFTILIRILNCIPEISSQIGLLLLFIGLLSTFWGTFFALRQKKVKKLIIYSSIAQVGFLLIALSSLEISNIVSVYFFLIIYTITAILIWSQFSSLYYFQNCINSFNSIPSSSLYFSNLSNFFTINQLWSFSLILIFFSIAGIPPLSGFLAKFLILLNLIHTGKILGATLLIVISAVSAFYYLRIIKTSSFEASKLVNIKNNKQIIFNDYFYFYFYLIINTLLLFLLLFIFFFPFLPFLLAQNIGFSSCFF